MLLSIIIVSYNTAELTVQTINSALDSLLKSKLLKDKSEIWVVDNHSSDDSLTQVKKLFKNRPFPHHIIANKKNLGFSGANNLAIQKAQGEYYLLLNSDTIVLEDALEKLVTTAQKENLDVAAAQLLNQDKTLQPQGGSLPTLLSIKAHMLMLDKIPFLGKLFPSTQHTGKNVRQKLNSAQKLTPLGWVGGTAMLLSAELIKKIGPLDDQIFMYGEDVEICLRAHKFFKETNQGLLTNPPTAIINSAQIIHLGSASSSSKNAIIGELKGYLYLWEKHYPSWQLPLLKKILKTGVMLRIFLFGRIVGDKKKSAVYQTALNTLFST